MVSLCCNGPARPGPGARPGAAAGTCSRARGCGTPPPGPRMNNTGSTRSAVRTNGCMAQAFKLPAVFKHTWILDQRHVWGPGLTGDTILPLAVVPIAGSS